MLAALVVGCGFAGAQTVQFQGVESTLPLTGSSTPQPVALAVDALGDVFVSDLQNNDVVKLTPNGNSYVQSTVATGLVSPRGIAIDGSGNVYIADYGGQQLYKATPSGNSYSLTTLLHGNCGAGPCAPDGVTVIESNIAFTSFGDNHIYYVSNSGGSPAAFLTLSANAKPRGLAWVTTNSAPLQGTLFISDYAEDEIWVAKYNAGWGAAVAPAISGLSKPVYIALDASSNLYIGNEQNNEVVEAGWTGSAWASESTVTSSALSEPDGVAIDGMGNVYIADLGHNRVLKETRAGLSLGTVAVGSTGTAMLSFEFTSTATPAG